MQLFVYFHAVEFERFVGVWAILQRVNTSTCIVNRIHVVRAMAFFIAGRNS